MTKRHRKRRVPQLKYTETRGIGWHVSYRDPDTGIPKKKRFGRVTQVEAQVLYHRWVAEHLSGDGDSDQPKITKNHPSPGSKNHGFSAPSEDDNTSDTTTTESGSLLHVASGLLRLDQERTRGVGEPRARGSIGEFARADRQKMVRDFLAFLNDKYGKGAVGKMLLTDLLMADVEAYNRALVQAGYSAEGVSRRLQIVKLIIDRAGRNEYGGQVLTWNWNSRDVVHGKPKEPRQLPTLDQLQRILAACDVRSQAMIWIAIGLGFGQSDLAAVEVDQISKGRYDLRRGKTGIERYGQTPPRVWSAIEAYLQSCPRRPGQLLFIAKSGLPIVHGRADTVRRMWTKLRTEIGATKDTLSGFYVLRHLGATEFGSREGCSIGEMKRWLGHSASSRVADVYMKPVAPEHAELIDWVRCQLLSLPAVNNPSCESAA